MPRVLFVGDVVGRPGRSFIKENTSKIKEKYNLDMVVVNGENSAGGAGITADIAKSFFDSGVDGITLGDHAFDQKDFSLEIETIEYLSRPANWSVRAPGKRYFVLENNGFRVGFFTVLGRTFMNKKAECPFLCADEILSLLGDKVDAVIVEIHAEATAEKVAFGRYLDGRAALVVGTHTHIPTADGCILPGGTAYLTDVGMTGPHDSIIGVEKEPIIEQFLDGLPRRYNTAKGDVRLNGCIVAIDSSGHASSFEALCIKDGEI